MEVTTALIDDLMLDLSLAVMPPTNIGGMHKTRTIAAVNGIATMTQTMGARELRKLEYSVYPLVVVLQSSDIDEPLVTKAAFALKSLMMSRVCMREFVRLGGLATVSKMNEFLLGEDLALDIKSPSHYTSLLEQLCGLYMLVAVHHPWDVVRAGGIRHCIAILRRGAPPIQASAVGALGAMCDVDDIAKQMFGNGATKPIIAVSDADTSSVACAVAGLGCLAQLARIPEVGIKIARQGVVRALEKGLQRFHGPAAALIRERAIAALSWMARIPQVHPHYHPSLHLMTSPRD
jgi:hypothetical protein